METQYLVPTGDGKSQIAIDIAEIVKAESRLADVAIVNQFTAPELLSSFNDTWLKLNKSVTQLTYQKNIAEKKNKDAIADAKLSCTDAVIQALGHTKASADLRAAYVQKDPKVSETQERLDEISFVLDTLRGKMEAFYNAYNSVKKLTGTPALPGQRYGDEQKRPASFETPPPRPPQVLIDPKQPIDPELQLPPGFGNARY